MVLLSRPNPSSRNPSGTLPTSHRYTGTRARARREPLPCTPPNPNSYPAAIASRSIRSSRAMSQRVAGLLELGRCLAVGKPREPLVRGGVRGEVEAPCLPPPDGVPIEMREPVPGVADIPRVQTSHVVGDEKCGGREPHVGE